MFSFLNLKWLSTERAIGNADPGRTLGGPWGSDEMVMVNGHPSSAWDGPSGLGPLNQWTSQEAYAKLMPSF